MKVYAVMYAKQNAVAYAGLGGVFASLEEAREWIAEERKKYFEEYDFHDDYDYFIFEKEIGNKDRYSGIIFRQGRIKNELGELD